MFYPGGGYPGSYAPPLGGGVVFPVAPGEVFDFSVSMTRSLTLMASLNRDVDADCAVVRRVASDVSVDRQVIDADCEAHSLLDLELER